VGRRRDHFGHGTSQASGHTALPGKATYHIYIGNRCRCGIPAGVKKSNGSASRDDVGDGLEQVAILVVRHLSDRTALNMTASSVLDTINRDGPTRVTSLATVAGVGQPAMTELVQRLEQQGLVIRVEDPGDGRAALVTITNAGRALLDDRRRYRRDRLGEMLTALPPEDEASLTLAMHVALPIIRRLILEAQRSRTQTDGHTLIGQSPTRARNRR
jgi:DNA-binding MarR family transcriptional regulator